MPPSATRVAGSITRTVTDAALLLSVLSRPDPRFPEPGGSTAPDLAPLAIEGLNIGVLMDMGFGPPTEPDVALLVERAVLLFQAHGARLMRIPPPVKFDVFPDLDRSFSAKAAIERDGLPPERRAETLPFMIRYCDAGDALSAKDYLLATDAIDRARSAFASALSPFDFVLSPVLPRAGFPAEALGSDPDYPSRHISFTCLVNQAGWPADSICCGFTPEGLPVGLQIIGGPGTDAAILRLSRAYEQRRGFDPGFPSL